MNIEINTNVAALDGVLCYSNDEHSFRFDVGSPADLASRVGPGGATSIAIGTLQVEVAVATRRALFAWGLHPRGRWRVEHMDLPRAQEGEVLFDASVHLVPGVTVTAAPVGQWATKFDPDSGWVRVEADSDADDMEVKIAEGVIVGGRDGALHSLWLHPIFE